MAIRTETEVEEVMGQLLPDCETGAKQMYQGGHEKSISFFGREGARFRCDHTLTGIESQIQSEDTCALIVWLIAHSEGRFMTKTSCMRADMIVKKISKGVSGCKYVFKCEGHPELGPVDDKRDCWAEKTWAI
eukprot:98015-Amphidinium_carterae.1